MSKVKFRVTFLSERDPAQLEKFLIKSLEKAGASIIHAEMKVSPHHGRPPVNRPKVELFLKSIGAADPETDSDFTVREVVNATELSEQAVGRVLRQMTNQGLLERHYQVGSAAVFTVTEKGREALGGSN